MSKIKCIIIDDEKLARDIVKSYLANHDNIEIVAECKNGFEGIKAIQELNPDLIFLDIQMPKINGFEMLELIEEAPAIIFTTAFDQYAIKAFEVNAIDYLLKPFSQSRFDEGLKKALNGINVKISDKTKYQKVAEQVRADEEYLNRIIIREKSSIVIIPVDDIDYLQAQDDYVLIQAKGNKYLKQKTMKYYESHLDPNVFMRIHRSYLVQIDRIKSIDLHEKDTYQATLSNNQKIPISKSGYSKLKDIFN